MTDAERQELEGLRKLATLMPLVLDLFENQFRQAMILAELLDNPSVQVKMRKREPRYEHELHRDLAWTESTEHKSLAKEMLQNKDKREQLIKKLRDLLATIPNKEP